jgi:hypothetical protein
MSEQQYRGRTFSPGEDWFAGGRDFALEKLDEVRGFLMDLAQEADQGSRRKRRRNSQRFYDLEDAARTVGDARGMLRADRNRWESEQIEAMCSPAGVEAVAQALYLNSPHRQEALHRGLRLPDHWWQEVPVSIRRYYVKDAEVAIAALTSPRVIVPSDERDDNPS